MSRLLIIALAVAVVTNAVPLPASERKVQEISSVLRGDMVELANISAPAYVVDLFTNITKGNELPEQNKIPSNDAPVNAVRSFPNLVSGDCGRLGFNISIISSSEFVLKASLRVRVNRGDYNGRMWAGLQHANGTNVMVKEVTNDWVEFSIDNIVKNWARQASHIQIEFIIKLRDETTDDIPCKGHLMTESEDRDQQPLLVVYSVQPNQEDIPIIKGIRRLMNQQSRKRRTSNTESSGNLVELGGPCSKHSVEEINMNWFNNNIVTNGRIIGPTRFQVSVCGGDCSRTVPQAPTHAILFHLMATSARGSQPHLSSPQQYKRCCVPLKYDNVSFVMLEGEGKTVYTLWTLEEASVRECGCIYYKQSTTITN